MKKWLKTDLPETLIYKKQKERVKMEPILIIMAAGMGSRYGGPKQIDPITTEGDIIMDFSLYDAYQAGFRRVAFIIKSDFEEKFRAHIEKRAGKLFKTYYLHQEVTDIPSGYSVPEGRTKPWGTAHAVLSAREVIDAPFAVINADDYYGQEAFSKIYDFLSSTADATHHCMVGFKIENTLSLNGSVARGICKAEDGFLADIEEHQDVIREVDGVIRGTNTKGIRHDIDDGTPVSMNLWGFSMEFLNVMKENFPVALDKILLEDPMKGEYYLPACIDSEVKAGSATVKILSSGDKWFGVTYKEDKKDVVNKFAEMKNEGKYPRQLW